MPWRDNWGAWGCAVHLKELPLWEVATVDEPAQDLPLIELDLTSVQPDSATITTQATTTTPVLPPSLATTVEPSCDITVAITQQLQGTLEWLQWASPTILTPVSLHSTPKRELPSVALGALPPSEVTRGSLWTKWGGPNHPCPNGKPYSGVPSGSHTRRCTQYHSYQPLNISANCAKIKEGAGTFPIPQLQASPRAVPAGLPEEVLQLQGQMNAALEQLLTTRATMDSHHRELELNAKLAMHMNKVQAAEAIKEAKVSHMAEVKEAELCQPGSKRLRHTTLPIPVSCSKSTGKVC